MFDQLPFWLYVFVTFTLPVWDWFSHTLDYGNVQEFITWIVAAGALIYAARAARAAQETNRQQSAQIARLELDRQKQLADERQAQARLVAAWCDSLLDKRSDIVDAGLRIRNASDVPVYAAIAYIGDGLPNRVDEIVDRWMVPPSDGSTVLIELDLAKEEDLPADLTVFDVILTFRDAAGIYWIRDANGTLREARTYEIDQMDNNFEKRNRGRRHS